MVTFTANKALGLPAVGGDTGVWGPPLNNNSSVLDASLGGSVTIPISSVAGSLTLLASNYNNIFLTFTGTITQNTFITLPAVGSFYVIQNQTGASSQFTVTLQTTSIGSQAIGAPPYKIQDIFTDGSNVKYRGMHNIGEYWDYAGSSVPNWVSACTVPPYLYCNGTTFSSATYPALATIIGSTTLPDHRGRVRMAINDGTGRVTSSGGVDGNTIFSGGGSQSTTLSSLHLPQLIDPGHSHPPIAPMTQFIGAGSGNTDAAGGAASARTGLTGSAVTGITYGSSSQIGTPAVQPTLVGGIVMIRAA